MDKYHNYLEILSRIEFKIFDTTSKIEELNSEPKREDKVNQLLKEYTELLDDYQESLNTPMHMPYQELGHLNEQKKRIESQFNGLNKILWIIDLHDDPKSKAANDALRLIKQINKNIHNTNANIRYLIEQRHLQLVEDPSTPALSESLNISVVEPTKPAIAIAWDTDTVDPDDYTELVAALNQLVQEHGAPGLKFIKSDTIGITCESGVTA